MSLGFDPKQRAENRKVTVVYYPGSAAADATENWPVLYHTKRVVLKNVAFVPQTAVTGADTNTAHLNVIDAGTDGTGTTELANKDYTNGVNVAAMDASDILTTDKSLAPGSVLKIQREKIGTGIALPEGAFVIEYTVDDWG